MQRVKRRIFSGVVCEQEVYTVSDRANIKKLNRDRASRTTKSARNTGLAYQSGNTSGWLMKTFRRFPYIVR